MPGERYIKPDVWKRLYAHSGNQCAFPGCCTPIFEDDGLYTAECCHIKAANPGGPRYDASQTAEDRNGLDNLMFLCSRHHTIVDADVETYTTEKLQQIKQEHEYRYSAENLLLTDEQLKYLMRSSERFWKRIAEIDHVDEAFADFKITVDADRATIDLLGDVDKNLKWIEDTFAYLSEDDATLAQRIREYLVQIGVDITEYDKHFERPYDNPFYNPHWEIHAIGTHNVMCTLRMHYLQLVVRALERISISEKTEHPLLQMYREKLSELQEHNYYVD